MESGRPDIELADEAATLALGARLGAVARSGDVILLSGDLGAGKTTLARGLIASLCGDVETPSPTYTLVQTYEAPDFEIVHADLYRLKESSEIAELGLEEAMETSLCLIEWPERLGGYRPVDYLDVSLSFTESGGRQARLTGHGADWGARLKHV